MPESNSAQYLRVCHNCNSIESFSEVVASLDLSKVPDVRIKVFSSGLPNEFRSAMRAILKSHGYTADEFQRRSGTLDGRLVCVWRLRRLRPRRPTGVRGPRGRRLTWEAWCEGVEGRHPGLLACLDDDEPVAGLVLRYGISRQAIYQTRSRYRSR